MKLTVNGREVNVDEDPSMPLLWVLRDVLNLTGTKYGCGVGICGACAVHVDGEVVRTCVTPLSAAEGKDLRTIEGLAEEVDGERVLHPVQQAFIDEQVPQCGWCMSGQIMTAAAFLAQNPKPTREEIVAAMGQSYCRCGCYVRILRAVEQAAGEMAAQPAVVEGPA